MVKPFSLCSGPRSADVAVVGEAPGREEEAKGIPFVGASGRFLKAILSQAGFNPRNIFFTNVLTVRPPNNDIKEFCVPKKELPADYTLPPLGAGKYLRPDLVPELDRLAEELRTVKPTIIIGVGGTASWALIQSSKISDARGVWFYETLTGIQIKTIFTYHPAAVLRQWNLRPFFFLDLEKAFAGRTDPTIRRPKRKVLLKPTLEELHEVEDRLLSAPYLVCDIETHSGQIDCIGFAPSPDFAVTVPFFDINTRESYWPTLEEEQAAWRWVRRILTSDIPKVFQNGMYDLQWLIGRYRIPVRNAGHDTMLMSHALHPERKKDLATLATIYTDEIGWKFNYRRSKDEDKED